MTNRRGEWRPDDEHAPEGTRQAQHRGHGSAAQSPRRGDDAQRLDRRPAAEPAAQSERPRALLAEKEADDLRTRWGDIQGGFVDEPRRAVQDADSLVAQTMKRLAEVFADERGALERQWSKGQDVSTEDLRVALTRYRSFFDRLLSV